MPWIEPYSFHRLQENQKIIEGSSLQRIHDRTFHKCSQIWNGSHRPKSSEAIKGVIGRQVTYPNATRWNSLQDCSLELLKVFNSSAGEGAELADNIFNKLLEVTVTKASTHTSFSRAEIECLVSYTTLMDPIAKGLDYLQGDISFYGQFFQRLTTIYMKVSRLSSNPALSTMKAIIPKVLERQSLAWSCKFTKFEK